MKLITDGAKNYQRAFKKGFYSKFSPASVHI
jgi:hypothetical protein